MHCEPCTPHICCKLGGRESTGHTITASQFSRENNCRKNSFRNIYLPPKMKKKMLQKCIMLHIPASAGDVTPGSLHPSISSPVKLVMDTNAPRPSLLTPRPCIGSAIALSLTLPPCPVAASTTKLRSVTAVPDISNSLKEPPIHSTIRLSPISVTLLHPETDSSRRRDVWGEGDAAEPSPPPEDETKGQSASRPSSDRSCNPSRRSDSRRDTTDDKCAMPASVTPVQPVRSRSVREGAPLERPRIPRSATCGLHKVNGTLFP